MLLAVRISSYGCSWEVWRVLKKLELYSAITKHEQILKLNAMHSGKKYG